MHEDRKPQTSYEGRPTGQAWRKERQTGDGREDTRERPWRLVWKDRGSQTLKGT